MTNVAIIYYSATGNLHAMARRLEEAAQGKGADVRRRQVTEIAPREAIEQNPDWREHVERTADEPRATPDDVAWADVALIGSPTRFGNVTSQLQQYLDTLGPLWAQGALADKVYAGFTSSQTLHGGQESTLLSLYHEVVHFGGILVTPGYTDPLKFADGNPYGASHVSGAENDAPLGDDVLAALDHLAERTIGVADRLAG
jgi:NAD(P)H dehydrogenase (quinone)